MSILKRFSLLLCLLSSGYISQAQHIEVGLMLGASNYLGDLSNETFLMSESHFSASAYGRFNISPRFALKGFFGYGRVSGDDKNFASEKRDFTLDKVAVSNFEFNKYRNLNFYSDVYEFSFQAEYNLLPNDLKSYNTRPFIPYVFLGLGIFNFNPKTQFNGKTLELQPLATEGQGSTYYNETQKYALTRVCIPIGLGFRQKIGEDFFVGIEGGFRFTNTNYIDDVGGLYGSRSVIYGATGKNGLLMSDRSWELPELNQDPNINDPTQLTFVFSEGDKRSDRHVMKNDMYFMTGITISYILRFRGQACPTFN